MDGDDMTNWHVAIWHVIPRDVVEAAATSGNVDAQAALRIHKSLDRIDSSVLDPRTELTFDDGEASLHEIVQAIRQAINDDPRYSGM